MEELNNKKIVQHNDLITSVAKMDKIPLKIFELAVSCIDVETPPDNEVVYLSKEELFLFFNVVDTNKYSRFKESIETMQKQAFFEIKQIADKGFGYKSIIPITTVSWNDYDDEVMVKFNPDIMPYLIDLKKNFTQYAIKDVMELNSKHSIVIYKWLSMNYNQYEYYQDKISRSKDQLDYFKNPVISIKKLREMTGTENLYTRITNFTKRVLDASIQEITETSSLNVSYEKIKKGGKISEIKFFITKKSVVKNEFYKEEQQDPAFLEEQKNEKEEMESLYAASMENSYTTLLWEHNLITFKDIQDKELMAGLQKKVYPLYDELEQRKGMGSADYHVSYVADRKRDYSNSKKNTLRYLHESIKNYLARADMK